MNQALIIIAIDFKGGKPNLKRTIRVQLNSNMEGHNTKNKLNV